MESETNSTGDLKSFETFDVEPESTGEKIFASIKIVIALAGLIGNFTVCLVTARLKRQNVHILIVTQAITDLLASLALVLLTLTDIFPLAVPTNAFWGYLYCFFWKNGVVLFSLFAISTFNLVAISLERYNAILHPISHVYEFSRRKVFVLAALAWVFGPMMEVTFVIFVNVGVEDGKCLYSDQYEKTRTVKAIGLLIFFWEYFIPCIIMAFCFTRIIFTLQKREKRWKKMEMPTVSATTTHFATNTENVNEKETTGNGRPKGTSSSAASIASKQTRNVTSTLITVFAVYVICWSTEKFLFLQYNLGGYIDFGGLLYGFAVSMAMLNSACNPIIYALRYDQYRKELKLVILCAGCKHNQPVASSIQETGQI
ncbi:neuropeptide receptor npr-1-like [Amphiura filiformis]|uniref:neuropeptide receptor npr-1-like n=1 Tax=Amphiura filiformis TaxID=82378 RepID=UPI003B211274